MVTKNCSINNSKKMYWGTTPALDLVKEYEEIANKVPEELNILLIGSVDCRHVLKTIARKYRHQKIKLNFHIVEGCVENIAKQLLILKMAFQHSEVLGFVRKTKFFMELYGNTLIRPAVAKYLTEISSELIKIVTDRDYSQLQVPFLKLEIRYKERDYLENLLKFWMGQDEFNICECWDKRVRQSLGVRYDSKLGAFDWDLHMRLHSIGHGSRICNQEYRNFRLTGVAFTWLESEVSKPNRTMVCGVIPNGEKFVHCGYLGDIQTGPFIAFGVDCEDEEFHKSTNGQNSHRATDITERNLAQIFHEIQHEEEYMHKKTSDLLLGPVVMQSCERRVVDFRNSTTGLSKIDKNIDITDVKITISSTSHLDLMDYKPEYKNLFNLIYFSNLSTKFITKQLINEIAAANCVILIENKRFFLNMREKQLREYAETIERSLDCEKIDFDPLKDDFFKFLKP